VRMFIKRDKLRKSGTRYTTGIRAIGFAALIETGGHTLPHTIKARGRLLANRETGAVFGRAVQHPGSRVPKEPYLGRSVTSSQPRIVSEIDKGFNKLGKALGL